MMLEFSARIKKWRYGSGWFLLLYHIHLYLKAEQYMTCQKSKSGKLRKKKLQFKFILEKKSKKWIFQLLFISHYLPSMETLSERSINKVINIYEMRKQYMKIYED